MEGRISLCCYSQGGNERWAHVIKLPMALVDILKPSQGVQLHVLGDSCQDFGGLSVVHLPAVVYINLDQQA